MYVLFFTAGYEGQFLAGQCIEEINKALTDFDDCEISNEKLVFCNGVTVEDVICSVTYVPHIVVG
jgi:hypothetical protein